MSDKVLVIRKPDRTIHQVPLANKPIFMQMNNRVPDGQKWNFEEMSKEEAAKLPFIDSSYTTPADAVSKLKSAETQLNEKDAKIAEMEAMLAKLQAGTTTPADAVSKTETGLKITDPLKDDPKSANKTSIK